MSLLVEGQSQQIGGDTFIRPKGGDPTATIFGRAMIVNQRGGSLQLHYGGDVEGGGGTTEWVEATDARFATPGSNFVQPAGAAADDNAWHLCDVVERKDTDIRVRYDDEDGRGTDEWLPIASDRFCATGDGFSDVLTPILAAKHWQHAAREHSANGGRSGAGRPIGARSARDTAALITGAASFGRVSTTSMPLGGGGRFLEGGSRRHSLPDAGVLASSMEGAGGPLLRKGTLSRMGSGESLPTKGSRRRRSSLPSARVLQDEAHDVDASPTGRNSRKRSLAQADDTLEGDGGGDGGGGGGGGQNKRKHKGKKKPRLHRTHSEVRRIRKAAGTSYRRRRHKVNRSQTAPLPRRSTSERRGTRTPEQQPPPSQRSHRRKSRHHHHHRGSRSKSKRHRPHHEVSTAGDAPAGLVAVASIGTGLVSVPEDDDDEAELYASLMTM